MTSRSFDIVIIGGGPAAAAECIRLCRTCARIAVITDRYGGCMRMLADYRLQSYLHELDIADSAHRLVDYIDGADRVNPTGAEYSRYVTDIMQGLPVTEVVGDVIGVERLGHEFTIEYLALGKASSIRSAEVIFATGLMPREAGSWAVPGQTMSCFEAYHGIGVERGAVFRNKDVVIVGSGNSAYQIAAGVARHARGVTILANRYLGLYPQESDNRFALRAPSQLALEMIAKGYAQNGRGPINCAARDGASPISLHIYSELTWNGHDRLLVADIHAAQNTAKVPAISLNCGIARGQLKPRHDSKDVFALHIPGDELLLISAIGVKARMPQTAWSGLLEPATGFARHDHGRTPVRGLYVAGACAGYPSVNSMHRPVMGIRPPLQAQSAGTGAAHVLH